MEVRGGRRRFSTQKSTELPFTSLNEDPELPAKETVKARRHEYERKEMTLRRSATGHSLAAGPESTNRFPHPWDWVSDQIG